MSDDKYKRVKDLAKDSTVNVDGLSTDMKDFLLELDSGLNNYYGGSGYSLVVTSGKREAEDKVGKAYKQSHHNTGDAIDLRADPYVYDFLYNSKEGLSILAKHNLGLIDETSKSTLSKTGGTAPHLHIGKDTDYVTKVKDRYNKSQENPEYLSFDGGGYVPIGLYSEGEGTQTFDYKSATPGSFQVYQGAQVPTSSTEAFLRDVEKEKKKEEKTDKSDARQEVEKKKKESKQQKEFIKSLNQEREQVRRQKPPQQSPYAKQDGNPIVIDVQSSLPNMPNIWQSIIAPLGETDKFQDGGVKPYYTEDLNDIRFKQYQDSLRDHLTTLDVKKNIDYQGGASADPTYLASLKTNYKRGYDRGLTTTNAEYKGAQIFDFPKPVQKVSLKQEEEKKKEPNLDTDLSAYLKTQGQPNSYADRKKLYEEVTGQKDYRGSAEQNIDLLNRIKNLNKEGTFKEEAVVDTVPAETFDSSQYEDVSYRTQWVRGEDGKLMPIRVPYSVKPKGKPWQIIEDAEPGYRREGSTIDRKQYGGLFSDVEVDPIGMYNGIRPVIIPSNRITMKGVDVDVLGVSDEGDVKLMKPNGEYKFRGSRVLEIPVNKTKPN